MKTQIAPIEAVLPTFSGGNSSGKREHGLLKQPKRFAPKKKGLTTAKPFKINYNFYYNNASNASVYAFLGETPT